MKRMALTVSVFVLLAVIESVVCHPHTCMCQLHEPREQYNHPQVLFNQADFSIKAKITKVFRTRYPWEWFRLKKYQWANKEEDLRCLRDRIYEVEVIQVYKGKDFHPGCVKRIRSYGTVGCPEKCGLTNLTRYETYLLSGNIKENNYYIDICGLNMRWSDVTPHQKNSLKGLYAGSKDCATKCIFSTSCSVDCYYKYATCTRQGYDKYGHCICGWKKGISFPKCAAGKLLS